MGWVGALSCESDGARRPPFPVKGGNLSISVSSLATDVISPWGVGGGKSSFFWGGDTRNIERRGKKGSGPAF